MEKMLLQGYLTALRMLMLSHLFLEPLLPIISINQAGMKRICQSQA